MLARKNGPISGPHPLGFRAPPPFSGHLGLLNVKSQLKCWVDAIGTKAYFTIEKD